MTVVLHVLEALEGGTARHVTDIVRHVPGVDHHVAVPARRVGGGTDATAVPAMRAAGATVHRVEMRRNPLSPRNAVSLVRLAALVRGLAPDVVHGHSSVGGALARLAPGGRAFRVYTPNGLHPSAAAAGVERLLGGRVDRLVAVSESEARIAAARGLAPTHRIAVIPNGIDIDAPTTAAPDLRSVAGFGEDGPLIGFVGRMVPQKAPLDFVEAAALLSRRLPNASFVMVGSGRLGTHAAAAAEARGLGGVLRLVGHLPGVAAAMDQLDALVLPSLYEGCPYAALEAMRAGVPVVTTDAIGCRDVVEDGVTGWVAPVGDVAGLAAAAERAVSDAVSSRRVTAAARRQLVERFDVARMAAELSLIYRMTAPALPR